MNPGPDFEIPLDFSFDDLVLDNTPGAAAPLDLSPSAEMRDLSRRLAGPYAEVVAAFASQALAGRSSEASLGQARGAVGSLRRLAEASADASLGASLGDLDATLSEVPPKTGRARRKYLDDLKARVLSLSDHLVGDERERVAALVRYEKQDRRALPLLDELAHLPGMGPKRLERLYCAGLFTVEAVCGANPEEIALVTGLPRPLARSVVDAARHFEDTRRRKKIESLRSIVGELNSRMRAVGEDAPDPKLTGLTTKILEDIGTLIAALGENS